MVDHYSRYRRGVRDPGDKPAVIKVRGKIGPDDPVRAATVKFHLGTVFAEAKNIEVVIDSGGGSVSEARQIYALLRSDGRPVTTRVVGECSSAATVVLMAGDYRKSVVSAKFVLHEVEARPLSGRWTAEAHAKESAFLRTQNAELAKLYAGRTGKPIAEFERAIRKDVPHDAAWARHMGLIYNVLDPDEPQVF